MSGEDVLGQEIVRNLQIVEGTVKQIQSVVAEQQARINELEVRNEAWEGAARCAREDLTHIYESRGWDKNYRLILHAIRHLDAVIPCVNDHAEQA